MPAHRLVLAELGAQFVTNSSNSHKRTTDLDQHGRSFARDLLACWNGKTELAKLAQWTKVQFADAAWVSDADLAPGPATPKSLGARIAESMLLRYDSAVLGAQEPLNAGRTPL